MPTTTTPKHSTSSGRATSEGRCPQRTDAGARTKQPWRVRARACLGIATLVPFGYLAFFTQPWATSGSVASLAWEGFGWFLLFSGTMFRFWATLYIGGRKAKSVVCEGPYSICRNPLYFGTFLITLSIAAFLESPIFLVGVLAASTVYLAATLPSEERYLRERLGAEYVEYCRRVPRFWPRLAGYRTAETIEVSVKSLRVETIRALRWAVIPLVTHAVLELQAAMR